MTKQEKKENSFICTRFGATCDTIMIVINQINNNTQKRLLSSRISFVSDMLFSCTCQKYFNVQYIDYFDTKNCLCKKIFKSFYTLHFDPKLGTACNMIIINKYTFIVYFQNTGDPLLIVV